MFFDGSRYTSVESAETDDDGGRAVQYKRIRFIPERDEQAEHTVRDGERLDHIAFEYYQEPDRFWRICDANGALWPPDLVEEPDRTLSIPTA